MTITVNQLVCQNAKRKQRCYLQEIVWTIYCPVYRFDLHLQRWTAPFYRRVHKHINVIGTPLHLIRSVIFADTLISLVFFLRSESEIYSDVILCP